LKDEGKIRKLWKEYENIKDKLSEDTKRYPIDREALTKLLNNKQEELLKVFYNYCVHYLHDADGVSLYPSAMILYPFPKKFIHGEDINQFLRHQFSFRDYRL
jgi:hypothetical protein